MKRLDDFERSLHFITMALDHYDHSKVKDLKTLKKFLKDHDVFEYGIGFSSRNYGCKRALEVVVEMM